MDISILNNKWVQVGASALVSFGGGTAIGYILGRRKTESMIVVEEGWMRVESFAELPTGDFRTHPVFGDISPDAEEAQVVELPQPEVEVVAEVRSIFVGNLSHWDDEAELAARNPEEPYVLTLQEFMADESSYRQSTVTYYAGDDIMADESDTPIYGYAKLMGELKFGHGSNDRNVCYIRNDVAHQEWEVLLHQGRFEEEILGESVEKEIEKHELKHYAVGRMRRE